LAPPSLEYPRSIIERLLALAAGVLGVQKLGVLMQDDAEPGMLVAIAQRGLGEELLGRRLPIGRGMAGTVLETGKPVSVTEYSELEHPHENGYDLHAGCAVPIEWAGRVRGALSAVGEEPRRVLDASEVDAVATLGRLTAAALEHADMGARLEPSMRVRVEAMSAAMMNRIEASADVIDMRDGYAPGRRKRLGALARQVGERLGLPRAELDELDTAARLHNAGKYKLPDAVLAKPQPLEQEERQLVTFHPEWGAEALARVPGLEAVAAIVLFHRERVDGTGYPHGLTGAHIPLASRIIGACDAMDAMLSDRPYRMRLEPIAAEGELRAGAESYFDEEIIEAVLAD
jgi:HD-GYP domain-containing protein (c-di-GMP phosphodiesterase class II)